MRRILSVFVLMILFATCMRAQLAENSWSFGIGGSYSRLMNHNITKPGDLSYGGFFSLQRNFNENVGLRIQPSYNHLSYENSNPSDSYTEIIALGFDFIYYIVPCKSITPYLVFGAAPFMYMLTKPDDNFSSDIYLSGKLNLGMGFEWRLSRTWSMDTELKYESTFTADIDGKKDSGINGIFTNEFDTFLSASIGFKYYYSKGKLSRDCMLPGGVTEVVFPDQERIDYDKIEDMIKENVPRVITREVVVEKPLEKEPAAKRWVLEGVTFRSGSKTLTAASHSILYGAINVLNDNPDMTVEIQGHTDSTGPSDFNLRLSEQRALSVKEFLVANGIDESRLSVRGYGESKPVSNNYTDSGRAMNRRIEFKILSR